jgi:hypothetical protein
MLLVLACCNGGYFAAECRYDDPVPFGRKSHRHSPIRSASIFWMRDRLDASTVQALNIFISPGIGG